MSRKHLYDNPVKVVKKDYVHGCPCSYRQSLIINMWHAVTSQSQPAAMKDKKGEANNEEGAWANSSKINITLLLW